MARAWACNCRACSFICWTKSARLPAAGKPAAGDWLSSGFRGFLLKMPIQLPPCVFPIGQPSIASRARDPATAPLRLNADWLGQPDVLLLVASALVEVPGPVVAGTGLQRDAGQAAARRPVLGRGQ